MFTCKKNEYNKGFNDGFAAGEAAALSRDSKKKCKCLPVSKKLDKKLVGFFKDLGEFVKDIQGVK